MDTLTVAERSERMSRVRGADSAAELMVRRLAHRLGYRFRKHRSDLPGRPDLAFPGRRKVIFVHGCFWHRHDCASGRRLPKTRLDFWIPKLNRNNERDKENINRLEADGWKVLIVWECETRDEEVLAERLRSFLDA